LRKKTHYLYAHLIFFLVVGAGTAKATTISNISQNASNIGRYQKYELTFTLSRTYTNPFDPCEADVTATFHKPDGTDVNIPGFYYRAYTVSGSNPERYTTAGAISWKARFAPSMPGGYTCDITVKDVDGTATATNAGSFTCQESGKKGFIRVDQNNHDFMKYANGDTRLNIGENIGWNGGGIYGWDNYLKKLHNAGANWVRLWSCHYGSDMGVALEWRPGLWGTTYFQGAGKPSLQTSLRMDKYVEIAEQNDIAIQFCLQHHGQFSTSTNPDWNDNPYNINAGGWLNNPAQYFTDPCARKLTKNKYRYIVARWGYSPAIFAWELFNEVQFTNGWWDGNQTNVVNWHNEMSSYIRSIDNFKHPVTTSSHGSGFENIWNLPDINIIQVHYYGTDIIHTLEQTALGLADFNKPVIMGEFGIGTEGSTQPEPYATQLKEGLEMHNGIWSSFLAKSSAHLWWWDIYVDPCNLYGVFTPLAAYAANENLANFNLTRAQRAVSGNEAYYANPGLFDFWAVSTQTVFYLQGDYFPGMEHLSRWLHGSWQSALKSDPNFHLNMPSAGALKIHVQEVAASGTNRIRVRVNGTEVFLQTFTNGSTNFIVTVSLSAGQQAVQIQNAGNDWFNISSYEFAPNNVSLLDSIGLSSSQRAYIWIYDVNSQYGLINHGTFHNEPVIVKGLEDGLYYIDIYSTRGDGGIIASDAASSVSGELTYTLPDFSKDIAVKVKPVLVDLYTLKTFLDSWLLPYIDLDGDGGDEDLADFSVFADHWMHPYPLDWSF
jgi:hypothetical protein